GLEFRRVLFRSGPSHEGISTRYCPPSAKRLRDEGRSYASRAGRFRLFRIVSVERICSSTLHRGGHGGHGRYFKSLCPPCPLWWRVHVANMMPRPQSAASEAPVIAEASSEATNATRFAISSGVAIRRSG